MLITQEDVDNAADLKTVINEFLDWKGDATLYSWGGYDKTQISKDMVQADLEHRLKEVEDHYNLKRLHAKWNGLKKEMGMSGALRLEGINLDGTHHRGIDDALNIAKIFRNYLDKI
jgi:3'-5' exoribonuclease 1